MDPAYKFLSIEKHGQVLWVTVDRQQDRNSINSALMAELTRMLESAEKSSARAVVFCGVGSTYFIGGADGIEMMRLGPEGAREFSVRIQELFNRFEQSPLILTAAIDGLCFGGGFEFAMACDFRVATDRSRIGLPEVKVGLIPGGGGTQRLPRLVGQGRALQMILSGRLYSGTEAADMGLVHMAVEPRGLEKGVYELLDSILRQPQYALSLAKRAVYASHQGSLAHGLAVETEQFGQCFNEKFFPDLMRKQLKAGTLTTTEDVSDFLEQGGDK